jgi:alanine dehydrogenase
VPFTSTYGLTNATLPYVLQLAVHGVADACAADPALALGVNTVGGNATGEKPSAVFDTLHGNVLSQ